MGFISNELMSKLVLLKTLDENTTKEDLRKLDGINHDIRLAIQAAKNNVYSKEVHVIYERVNRELEKVKSLFPDINNWEVSSIDEENYYSDIRCTGSLGEEFSIDIFYVMLEDTWAGFVYIGQEYNRIFEHSWCPSLDNLIERMSKSLKILVRIGEVMNKGSEEVQQSGSTPEDSKASLEVDI